MVLRPISCLQSTDWSYHPSPSCKAQIGLATRLLLAKHRLVLPPVSFLQSTDWSCQSLLISYLQSTDWSCQSLLISYLQSTDWSCQSLLISYLQSTDWSCHTSKSHIVSKRRVNWFCDPSPPYKLLLKAKVELCEWCGNNGCTSFLNWLLDFYFG